MISINPILSRSAGLDVHHRTVVCTVLIAEGENQVTKTTRHFKTFRSELVKLAHWLNGQRIEVAVMESTGIYWKSVYRALEEAEVTTLVVNARHVKVVPGRKTDACDSEWLAELGRYGLLRGSIIPPSDFREWRLLTRYRRKLSGYVSAEKNRLHKLLDDCGIRLGCVVSDIDGVSARSMIEALIEGSMTPVQIARLAKGTLNRKVEDLILSLEGDLSDRHRFLLKQVLAHLRGLEEEIRAIDRKVEEGLAPYKTQWQLLQTIPGLDQASAAMLLVEIGVDMSRFGHKERLCSWAGVCPGNNESAGKKKVAEPDPATIT
ncbi:MAG: IS110 family transposase [Deltaproteobacteria bacterium]|nr:IS110 family transposase [Deltaproteobacteria bacterium]